MGTARERARNASKFADINWRYADGSEGASHGRMLRMTGADAASDVWEPIVKDLIQIAEAWWAAWECNDFTELHVNRIEAKVKEIKEMLDDNS